MSAMETSLTPYQFRYCPARYMDESHLPEHLARLAASAGLPDWRRQNAINGWLLAQCSLPVEYEFPPVLGGLALYDQPALELTLGCLGALLHGQAIRQLVDAGTLKRIYGAIGEAGHRYCLEQQELIIGRWPAGWQRPLPEGDLAHYMREYGLKLWLFASGALDDGYARRLVLRLPRSCALPEPAFVQEQIPLAKALCLKVARHVSPTCFHLLN